MRRGIFITFEGGEGTGKSTQCRLLADALQQIGFDCVLTREPGGTPSAEEVRNLVVNGQGNRWDETEELLLFMTARRNHLREKIWPALSEGKIVICDRFLDSTIAYQGYGRQKNQNIINNINQIYHLIAGNFYPDITIILDIDPTIGLKRSCTRTGNTEQRFESMDITFHENLRHAYLELAKNNNRYYVVDASKSIEEIHDEIVDIIKNRIKYDAI